MYQKSIVIIAFLLMLSAGKIMSSDWRFPVNLTYSGGVTNVFDTYKEILESKNYSVSEEMIIPIGVSFQPYVQFDNVLRIGGGIGPLMLVLISDYTYFGIPLKVDAGVTFIPGANVSPYFRGGLAYHLAFGDFVESSTPGLFVAFGMEFLRQKRVSFGAEIGYDFSSVDLRSDEEYYDFYSDKTYKPDAKSVKAGALQISLFAEF